MEAEDATSGNFTFYPQWQNEKVGRVLDHDVSSVQTVICTPEVKVVTSSKHIYFVMGKIKIYFWIWLGSSNWVSTGNEIRMNFNFINY